MWFVTDGVTTLYQGDERTAREIFHGRRLALRPEYGSNVRLFEGIDRSDNVSVLSTASAPASIPEVSIGDGATVRVGSDCYPYTVIEMTPSRKTLTLRGCTPRLLSGSFQSNDALIEYAENPAGPIRVARWSAKYNKFMVGGQPVGIGIRRYYQDPSY